MTLTVPASADVAILGGGANGAGLARVAVAAGYSVVLFEKGDFASGTSGRSTKLVHGGLRYLEHGHLGLVHESLRQRSSLLSSAPHLVKPLGFVLPSYTGDPRPSWKLRAGLALYDALAGSHGLGRHSWLSPQAAHALAPGLREAGLVGAGLYFDAQVNDARLVLEDILWAVEHGATCLNHCPVTRVATRSPQNVEVEYQHLPSKTQGQVSVRCLIVAAGPWTDKVQSELIGQRTRWLRPTRGSHIVVPEILDRHAVFGASPVDGRMFFIIPWRGASLVGTTDIDDADDPDHTKPTPAEVNYLLEGVVHYFPKAQVSHRSVIAGFAGLRPLVRAQASHASSISREDRIVRAGPIVTLLGGKLTTYRAMAEKAWSQVREVLPPAGRARCRGDPWPKRVSAATSDTSTLAQRHALPVSLCDHLASFYGPAVAGVLKLIGDDPALCEPLCAGCSEIGAQVAHAAIHERALHLDDVLLRRLPLGMGKHRVGDAVDRSADIMARLLGWDVARRTDEIARYLAALYPPATLQRNARGQ